MTEFDAEGVVKPGDGCQLFKNSDVGLLCRYFKYKPNKGGVDRRYYQHKGAQKLPETTQRIQSFQITRSLDTSARPPTAC